ncbi:MAG: DUF4253 domain-containing protein [Bacteroidia bacterium]|nr:DUF4253 domain-containing protein [Bacteroidia bacterium]
MKNTGIFLLVLLISSCVNNQTKEAQRNENVTIRALEPLEVDLISQLNIDSATVQFLLSYTDSTLIPFDKAQLQSGAVLFADYIVAERFLTEARDKLRKLQLIPMYIEYPLPGQPVKIGIIKAVDQFGALEKVGTMAYNEVPQRYISTKKLIDLIKEWDKRSKLILIGADDEWIRFKFGQERNDLDEIAQVIAKLCPEQLGYHGTVNDLKRYFEAKRIIEFEWH